MFASIGIRSSSPTPSFTAGCAADPDATEITDPVIVVEVQSPGTRAVDSGLKLTRYFGLESVIHYLIVDPVKRLVIHHRRAQGGLIETRIATRGARWT
ncbi:Uma2 family endonuclease [Methylobacterium oryzae CBMB20]